MVDLAWWVCIWMVFLFAFGLAYHVNMFPAAPADWSILANVIYYPYFQIYGELFLGYLKGIANYHE